MSSKTAPPSPIARRSNPPHKSYKHIALFFVVLAILLVLGVTYLALSKVKITLVPSDELVSHDFNLIVAEDPSAITSANVVVAGKIFSAEKEDASQEFSVVEGKTVDGQAEGTVTLYNKRGQPQTLVATTRLLTPDNILFRLEDQVTVPADSSVQAKVYADQEGPSGNIPPATFIIPGLSESLQELVYAQSTSAMLGGTRQIGVLTTKDTERAEEQLIKNNSAELLTQFIDQLEDKKMELIDTQTTISNTSYDKELGEEVDSFTYSADLSVSAVFAEREKILSLAKNKLKESRGPQGEFINVDPSSLTYELLEVDLDNLQAQVKVSISGLSTFDPDQDIFDKNLLVGFTQDDLKLYFSQFESIQEAKVEFSPFWVKKVPILKDHIYIVIQQ